MLVRARATCMPSLVTEPWAVWRLARSSRIPDGMPCAWGLRQVAIRNIRKGVLDKIKKMKKAIGDDAAKDAEEEVQKVVKKFETEVGDLVTQREKEIMGN